MASNRQPGPGAVHKFAFIDSIRGIAFLGVFLTHSTQTLASYGSPAILVRLATQTGIGVQLFFIASALTLMLSLDARSASEAHPIRNFYLRRFFRIAPLFYLAAVFYTLAFDGNRDPRVPHPVTLASFLTTLTFTNAWSPRWINQVVPGGWSISVEMMFYLIIPFLHAHLKGLGQALLATLAIFAAGFWISEATGSWLNERGATDLPGMNDAFAHLWMPYQLYRFFAGFTLYFLVRDRLRSRDDDCRSRGDAIRALGLLVVSLATLAASTSSRVPKFLTAPSCTMALVFFCWSLATSPLPLIVNAATRLVGKLSFGAYVSHFAVIFAVDRALGASGLAARHWHWAIIGSAFLVTSLGLTLVVSELLHRWVERPGQALGRLLIARLEARRGGGPALSQQAGAGVP